jgi:hypothetical protein
MPWQQMRRNFFRIWQSHQGVSPDLYVTRSFPLTRHFCRGSGIHAGCCCLLSWAASSPRPAKPANGLPLLS